MIGDWIDNNPSLYYAILCMINLTSLIAEFYLGSPTGLKVFTGVWAILTGMASMVYMMVDKSNKSYED